MPFADATRVALKIDVDTYRGTLEGVPAMLDDLRAARVKASFYFTLGPDRSGRAIFRVFTKPGFLAKMLRTNAVKMYGWKTALYGTLLPAPRIAERCAAILRRCQEEGHEVGLHAWDHIVWQDRLHAMERSEVVGLLRQGIEAFRNVFGAAPKGFAAPAWYATDDAWEILARQGFEYLSVSRGVAPPLFPCVRERVLPTLEIPTTLSTLDEDLGRDGTTPENYVERLLASYRPGATEVLTVHAETEGLAYRHLFQGLLKKQLERGIETIPLRQLAMESRDHAPAREVGLGLVPGRAGRVAVVT
jgi:peptidoglycan/xylan/chitin deacetylase (PgdA/CDA1 family)